MTFSTIAEINLGNLAANARAVRELVSPARVVCVVKADAYGHGAVAATRHLVKQGFDFFAVARLSEAVELREAGITAPILLFGRLFSDQIAQASQYGIRLSVFCTQDIEWIEKAGLGAPIKVHAKVDTGMGRVGTLCDNAPEFFRRLAGSQAVEVEGLYSHFASADEANLTYALLQLERFRTALASAADAGISPPMIHISNSGGILALPEARFTAVRPGIFLYGHYPSVEVARTLPARQVMALKATVAHVRNLPASTPVSYGSTWTTCRPSTIAVIAAGYADGVDRRMGNRCCVLISGQKYPIVGRVTMDQIMADVTGSDVRVGDAALLWGDSDQGGISLLEVSEAIGTITYELTCGVGNRVPRIYTP